MPSAWRVRSRAKEVNFDATGPLEDPKDGGAPRDGGRHDLDGRNPPRACGARLLGTSSTLGETG